MINEGANSQGKTWNEVETLAQNRSRWKQFVGAIFKNFKFYLEGYASHSMLQLSNASWEVGQ